MRSSLLLIASSLTLLTVLPCQASRIHRGPTSSKHRPTKLTHAAAHPRAIDNQRATQIQTALVKAGYLNEVTGHWDSASEGAMQKLQGDNGWQTKLTPDSRALIKLGLGPNATPASAVAPVVPTTVPGSYGQ